MDLEPLKSASPWLVYLAAGIPLAGIVFKWLYLRVENSKLSSQRTERFYKLVSDGSWRWVSPTTLMMAYGDAFRRELDDRLIRFALERHRPLPLLRDLGRCVGMVKLADDGTRLVKWRGLKFSKLSYRRHSQIAFFAGFTPYVGLMIFAGLFPHILSHQVFGWLLGGLLVWVPIMMIMANFFETAHRLVEALDEVYPPWKSAPSATTLPESKPQTPAEGAEKPFMQIPPEEEPEESDVLNVLVNQSSTSLPAVPLTIVSRGG